MHQKSIITIKTLGTMKQEFYDRLKEVIRECEAHPYKSSQPINLGGGYEGRISKENLGEWSKEDYKTMYNHMDEQTERICEKSTLDCFVYCERGGFMYLVFY